MMFTTFSVEKFNHYIIRIKDPEKREAYNRGGEEAVKQQEQR